MGAKEAKGQKQADWRKKREEFIATLRAAKEAQRYVKAGGNLKDLPPPPPMDTSDYIQCPHCERRCDHDDDLFLMILYRPISILFAKVCRGSRRPSYSQV